MKENIQKSVVTFLKFTLLCVVSLLTIASMASGVRSDQLTETGTPTEIPPDMLIGEEELIEIPMSLSVRVQFSMETCDEEARLDPM